MELKTCRKCKQGKPATDEYFYRKKNHLTSPCKQCQRRKQTKYDKKHPRPTGNAIKQKNYRTKNQNRLQREKKSKLSDLRLLALWHYGGQPPSCQCCGEKSIQFLCLSGEHRQQINSYRLYLKVKKAGYPKGYEVLCQNCCHAKITYGSCPHQHKNETQHHRRKPPSSP